MLISLTQQTAPNFHIFWFFDDGELTQFSHSLFKFKSVLFNLQLTCCELNNHNDEQLKQQIERILLQRNSNDHVIVITCLGKEKKGYGILQSVKELKLELCEKLQTSQSNLYSAVYCSS